MGPRRTTRSGAKAEALAEAEKGKVAKEPVAEEVVAEVKAAEEVVAEVNTAEEPVVEGKATEEKVAEEKAPVEEVAVEKASDEKAAVGTAPEEKAVEGTVAEEEPEKPGVDDSQVEVPNKKAKTGVAIGDTFPDIGELECDEPDKKVNLTEVLKSSGAVVFFYPRANTPGCQKQAAGFNENLPKFEAAGYKVFGMSADKPKAQSSWKTKQGFKYSLLCNTSFKALKELGVTKTAKTINRSHMVVEKGGKIIDVQYGVKPADSYTGALKTVEGK